MFSLCHVWLFYAVYEPQKGLMRNRICKNGCASYKLSVPVAKSATCNLRWLTFCLQRDFHNNALFYFTSFAVIKLISMKINMIYLCWINLSSHNFTYFIFYKCSYIIFCLFFMLFLYRCFNQMLNVLFYCFSVLNFHTFIICLGSLPPNHVIWFENL